MNQSQKFNGKFILTGEHAVVYGYPALAGPVSKGINLELAEKNGVAIDPKSLNIFQKFFGLKKIKSPLVKIISDLPRNSGLGSSAAFAAATFSFLAEYLSLSLSKNDLFKLVQKSENIFHGNASGIDAAVVAQNNFIKFQKNKLKKITYLPDNLAINLKKHQPLLINSGQAKETTKELVSLVASKRNLNKIKIDSILERIGIVSEKIQKGLEDGSFNPQLIIENQRLLEEIGVVGKKAKKIIKDINKIGGVVKVTGAGGVEKGSGYLLAIHPDTDLLRDFLNENSMQYFPVFA